MSGAEKTQAVKEFDRPIPPNRMKPLTKKQRLLWERARAAKPDISIYVHEGRTDVRIHLDPELMTEARAYARKNRTTLPNMIASALRGFLASAG